MRDICTEELLAQSEKFDREQAFYYEMAHIARRLAEICQGFAIDREARINQIGLLLDRLQEAEDTYGMER